MEASPARVSHGLCWSVDSFPAAPRTSGGESLAPRSAGYVRSRSSTARAAGPGTAPCVAPSAQIRAGSRHCGSRTAAWCRSPGQGPPMGIEGKSAFVWRAASIGRPRVCASSPQLDTTTMASRVAGVLSASRGARVSPMLCKHLRAALPQRRWQTRSAAAAIDPSLPRIYRYWIDVHGQVSTGCGGATHPSSCSSTTRCPRT